MIPTQYAFLVLVSFNGRVIVRKRPLLDISKKPEERLQFDSIEQAEEYIKNYQEQL